MIHINDKLFSALCGAVGGLCKMIFATGFFLAQIDIKSFLFTLFQAGITALVCGLLGAAGKYAFDIIKIKILKRKK